jgi:predicted TIM-barrel fold metal-dependent hydrolase
VLIIDCHAHITSPDERKYRPKEKPLRPPAHRGSAEDLRKESLAAGVTAVRAIQTVSFYGYDNSYLVDSAKANKGWMSGVVTLEPDDPRSAGLLRTWFREYNVRSLRSIPSGSRKTFDDGGVRALWRVAADEGMTIDLFLMQPAHIAGAVKLLLEFPRLTVGFCHCMDLKPGPRLADDLASVLALSSFPNLLPKVDFIGTGTQKAYPCDDLHEPCMRIIREYGAERCLWTSCYPNELWTPKISYKEHVRIFTEALPLKDSEKQLILGENARKIWFPELPAA